jgi:hypothetical protein
MGTTPLPMNWTVAGMLPWSLPFRTQVFPACRLSLEPLRRLDRSALATDLRQLQATMPLTPSVIEDCRGRERW